MKLTVLSCVISRRLFFQRAMFFLGDQTCFQKFVFLNTTNLAQGTGCLHMRLLYFVFFFQATFFH